MSNRLSNMTESELDELKAGIEIAEGFSTSESMKEELRRQKEEIDNILEFNKEVRKKAHKAFYSVEQNIFPLCCYAGGSHLYGLNNADSDLDIRGVFMNTEPGYILGLNRFDEIREQNPAANQDVVFKELTHFLRQIQKGNPESLEMLWMDEEQFAFINPIFRRFRLIAPMLTDSEKFYNSIVGYTKSEIARAFPLDSREYKPKMVINVLRLSWMATEFFNTGVIRVSIHKYNTRLHEMLMTIKNCPEDFSRVDMWRLVENYQKKLFKSFEEKRINLKFNDWSANKFLTECYLPYLNGPV